MKKVFYSVFIFLTGCGLVPTNKIAGNVDKIEQTSYAMPSYVFYSLFGSIVVLVAIIFLFVKSPLK